MNIGSAPRLGCALTLFCAMTLAAVPATADAQADGTLVQLPGSDACIEDRYAASTTLCPIRGDGLDNPGAAAVSPDGRHLYTTSIYGDAVAAFSLNATTGAVRQLAGNAACIEDVNAPAATVCPVRTSGLNGAIGVTVSPDGRHVYVSSIDSSAVVIFKRDALTGALSQTPGAECVRDSINAFASCPRTAKGLAGAMATVVSPDGHHAYVVGGSSDAVAAFSRDPVSGSLTQLPGTAACFRDTLTAPSTPCPATVTGLDNPRGLTITPDGRHVYADRFGPTP